VRRSHSPCIFQPCRVNFYPTYTIPPNWKTREDIDRAYRRRLAVSRMSVERNRLERRDQLRTGLILLHRIASHARLFPPLRQSKSLAANWVVIANKMVVLRRRFGSQLSPKHTHTLTTPLLTLHRLAVGTSIATTP
jgi:hypothetical protein